MSSRENNFAVISVNVSTVKGSQKESVDTIEVDENGVIGDAHYRTSGKEISMLDKDIVDRFTEENGMDALHSGVMGENITIRADGKFTPQVGEEIRIGEVILIVTQIGKKCHGDGCAIFRNIGKCVMPSAGIFCSVREGGVIAPGMHGSKHP